MRSLQHPTDTPSDVAGHARIEPAGRALTLRTSASGAHSDLIVQQTKKRLAKCAGLLERAALAVRQAKRQPTAPLNDPAQGSCQTGIDEKRFAYPFRVHLAELGTVRYVSDVHEALDCLIYGWPAGHSLRHAHALDTCLKVLAKARSTTEAEAAFGEAAEEAGILLHGPIPR
jgi:Protein of unknown function (DUF982)